jgi:hypothetical protein
VIVDRSPEVCAPSGNRRHAGGEAQADEVQSCVSGDFVVLVLIERQRGEVGGAV